MASDLSLRHQGHNINVFKEFLNWDEIVLKMLHLGPSIESTLLHFEYVCEEDR